MPETTITLGELHTAFRAVWDAGALTKQQIADTLDTSPTRAGNILRQLEDEEILESGTSVGALAETGDILWRRRYEHQRMSPEEANGLFDTKFPGLSTIEKTRSTKPNPSQGGRKVMSSTTTQFAKATDAPSSKKYDSVAKMIDLVRKADSPVAFVTGLCEPAGAKYPQDVEAALMALELVGLVERYTYTEPDSTRSRVAYQWIGGDDASRPQSPTSTASKKSSPKKAPAKAKEATAGK